MPVLHLFKAIRQILGFEQLDKVADELKGEKFELIASILTKEQEDELMAACSAE